MSANLLSGALIVVAMRWSDRAIGLVSTMVLARLLVPEDFGIVAMASLVVGLVDVVLDLGVAAALIHRGQCDHEDYSSAWTIRLIQAAIAGSIIAALAPFAGDFYHDPRVTPVLLLMAVTTLAGGLENIGIVMFQKDMTFGKDFQFFFLRRCAGFVATLALAWYFRSYWALPLGALVGRLFGVALSYLIHPFRPRLTLSRLGSIWSFSQWMLVRSIGAYADARLDKILVGRRFDATTTGSYSLADEISAMPTTELLAPLGRVLFPAFVSARDKGEDLKRIFLLSIGLQTAVALPAAAGLALVAGDAVRLLLGERWVSAIPFIQILSLIYGITSIVHAAGYLMMTLGKTRLMAIFMWGQVAAFVLVVFLPIASESAINIAVLRLLVTATAAAMFLLMLTRIIPTLSMGNLLSAIWRPLLATGIMAALLLTMPPLEMNAAARLTLTSLTGALIYSASLMALWWLSGRPEGGEAYLLGKLKGILARR